MQLALSPLIIWPVAGLSTAGILVRPFRLAEAWWAVAGALLLVLLGQLSAAEAGQAAWQGRDVYLFLIGMMLISELARTTGLFDWVAAWAVRQARGSATRLFCIVYAVGIVREIKKGSLRCLFSSSKKWPGDRPFFIRRLLHVECDRASTAWICWIPLRVLAAARPVERLHTLFRCACRSHGIFIRADEDHVVGDDRLGQPGDLARNRRRPCRALRAWLSRVPPGGRRLVRRVDDTIRNRRRYRVTPALRQST